MKGGAGWTSAVGLLAIYRLETSEKEIHFAIMSVANAKLAPTSVIAFHVQPALPFTPEPTVFQSVKPAHEKRVRYILPNFHKIGNNLQKFSLEKL